jgi:hypothetical protein
MNKALKQQLIEISEAGEKLKTGQKKLLTYRANNHQQTKKRIIKIIDDFAVDCGFTVQLMGGCKLLTKVK